MRTRKPPATRVSAADYGSRAVEQVRRSMLETAQGGDSATRLFVIPADGRAFVSALRAAVTGDGGRVIAAHPTGQARLDGAYAIVRELAGRTRTALGPAGLARHTFHALQSAESPCALVLDGAHDADEATVRWWWSLARRLAAPGTTLPVVLLAVVNPSGEVPRSAWGSLESRLGLRLGLRRLERPEAPGAGAAVCSTTPDTKIGERPRLSRAHRCLLRAAIAAMRGRLEASARFAQRADRAAANADDLEWEGAAEIAVAFAALAAGAQDTGERLESALSATAVSGDPLLHSVSETLAALRYTLEGDLWRSRAAANAALPLSHRLPEVARALLLAIAARDALRAGDPVGARQALEALGWGPGHSDAERSAVGAPRPARSARSARGRSAALVAGWIGGLVALQSLDGTGRKRVEDAAVDLEARRWPLLAGMAFLDAAAEAEGDGEATAATRLLSRARAAWERAGNRELVARLGIAHGEGVSAPGRAVASGGAPETIDAFRPLVAAGTREEIATCALEAARSMVPSRGGSALVGAGSAARTVSLRGRAALLSGFRPSRNPRLSAAVRSPRTGLEHARFTLDRLDSDPPFSRDERRRVESIAGIAGAAFDRVDGEAFGRPHPLSAAATPVLDDRLSAVERTTLLDAMERHEGNLSRASRALGLSRNGLKMKLARHGLR